MAIGLIAPLLVALVSLPALGQEPIPQQFLEELARDLAALEQQPDQAPPKPPSVRVVANDSSVYAGASTETRQLTKLRLGDEAKVIDNIGGWYAIQLPNQVSGWVQARNVAPVAGTYSSGISLGEIIAGEMYKQGETESGWFEQRILSLLERAATFRDSYRDNPYVAVNGFDISLSLTGPTLGMSFEFKD